VRALLGECLQGQPGEVLRRVPGRETYALEGPNGAAWVVKRYTHRWQGRSPARQEYEALEVLGRAGLRVPRPLGYLERDGRSVVAMERIEAEATLREVLGEAAPGELQELLSRLLELVLALHLRGWHHRDLYLHHVLLDEDGELVLIDLGRARRPRWFAKDLAALLLWTPAQVGVPLRLRFLARYMDRMGIVGRRTRRRFTQDVLRRSARMARHRPRHGEVGAWEEPA